MSDELTVALSKHHFNDGSQIFSDSELRLKHKNFIYAKNGSGKSTLTKFLKTNTDVAIKENNVDVLAFRGFEYVLDDNNKLNAVVLGEKNVTVQKQIDALDIQLEKLNEDKTKLESERKVTTNQAKSQKDKIDTFKTHSARDIKNSLAVPDYNKVKFSVDIKNSQVLSENELNEKREVLKEQEKPKIRNISYTHIVWSDYLNSVNDIIGSGISKPDVIPGLSENPSDDKGKFARQGMRIHDHEPNETCAFCGNVISEDRWELLLSYFSDEYQRLDRRINKGIDTLREMQKTINQTLLPDESQFYEKFKSDINQLVLNIGEKRREQNDFINVLINSLRDKQNNMAVGVPNLNITIPSEIDDYFTQLNNIVEQSNDYTTHINQEKNKAKEVIRLHEVAQRLDDFHYEKENQQLISFKEAETTKNVELQALEKNIVSKNSEKKKLISQTQNVQIIVDKINDKLSKFGHTEIQLVFEGKGNKGIYRIENENNKRRDIDEISTGEKNVIAFLYFINSIEKSDNGKRQLIIFDDPMNSNDDTMQYLIIMELQKLIKNIGENYVLILTHSTHFYLNIKFRVKYNSNNFYHLNKNGKQSIFKRIEQEEEDFSTNYDQLWDELKFLYIQDKVAFMLNPIRRILETFIKFNNISPADFYQENEGAKKLFDVNSHSIDDLEWDLNGKTKEEVMQIVKTLFNRVSTDAHFENHWKI